MPVVVQIAAAAMGASPGAVGLSFVCGGLAALALQVPAAVQVWRLLREMGERGADPLPGVVLCMCPVLNWLFIPLMLDHAARALRRHGLPVGIVGVSKAKLAALPTECCPKCWYDMAGLDGNVCPECGVTMTRRNNRPVHANA